MDSHTVAALKTLNGEALAALEAAAATCSEINDTFASIGLDSAVSAVQQLNDDALVAQRAFRDELASMSLACIVAKWQAGANRSWDGEGEQPPIEFTRFLDGCVDNYMTNNCVTVTPHQWFSAPDGHDWCVPFTQRFSAQGGADDISLTATEEAFVLENFGAFAKHFEPM